MRHFLKIIKNKYVIATLIFVIVFLFIDENNAFVLFRLKGEVRELHKEEAALRNEIVEDSIMVNSLRGNMEALERYGREEYFMKRSNEEIYIYNDDSEGK